MIIPTHQNHGNQYTMIKQLHNWGTPFLPCNWCIPKKTKQKKHKKPPYRYGWMRGNLKIKKYHRARDRPAFCIWPDQGERQLCVWCHSSESHQSHTGRDTSESRTHNCLPLKKHSWDLKNRTSLSSGGGNCPTLKFEEFSSIKRVTWALNLAKKKKNRTN